LAAAVAAFRRAITAFTSALTARISANSGLTALRLPKGAPRLRCASVFALRASPDKSPGKPTLPVANGTSHRA
jgi:LSD1 subclass zinc finger protein